MKKFRKINEAEVQETEETKKTNPEPQKQGNIQIANPLSKLTQLKDKIPTLLESIIKFASTTEGKNLLKRGDGNEDKVQIEDNTNSEVTVNNLIATQNVVYIANTCKIAVQGSEGEKFDGPIYEASKLGKYDKLNIWVAGVSEPTHIIDGHHRWSAMNMLNPNTKISGMIWIKLEPSIALAYLTAALRALDKPGQNQGPPEGNPTPVKGNCNFKTIKEEMVTKVGKERSDNFVKKYNEEFKDLFPEMLEKTFTQLSKNLINCESKIPSAAPPRELMPQLGFNKEDPNLEKDVINNLNAGKIDIKEPFAIESHIIKTYEKFMQNWKTI